MQALSDGEVTITPSECTEIVSSPSKLKNIRENIWVRLGFIADDLGDLAHLIYCFENALSCDPFCYVALNSLSLAYEKVGRYNRALEYLQRLLALDAENALAWVRLGHCCLMVEDYSGAYASYHKAISLGEKTNTKLWFGIGKLSEVYGSFLEAEKAYRRVLQDDRFPMRGEARFGLASILKEMKRFDASLQLLEEIKDEMPSSMTPEEIQLEKGDLLVLKGDINTAISVYKEVSETKSKSQAFAFMKLGKIYLEHPAISDHLKMAVASLTNSLEINNSSGEAWHLLGQAYVHLEQHKDAYDAFQQAIYKDVTNVQYWCSVGSLFCQLKQYKDALDAYSRAIRLDCRSARAWFLLGKLYQACFQFSDSEDALRQALQLSPKNQEIMSVLKEVREKMAQPAVQASDTLSQFAMLATHQAKRPKHL